MAKDIHLQINATFGQRSILFFFFVKTNTGTRAYALRPSWQSAVCVGTAFPRKYYTFR